MAEAAKDKELDRQTLSRLASSWSKVSKFTLQAYADAVPVTRSNLYAQVSDPEKGKRLGIDALIRAAFVTGVRVNDDGRWSLVDGLAQLWPWKGEDTEDGEAIQAYLKQVHEKIGALTPFKVTKVSVIKDRYYQAEREYALIEIADRQGSQISAMVVADTQDQINNAVKIFVESGVCEVTADEIVLTPEMALQLIHGPISKPQPLPNLADIPWNEWIPAIQRWHLMGIDPKAVETILSVARGGVSATEAKKQSAPDFIPGSESEPKSWKF